MKRYEKIPYEVDAVQWDGKNLEEVKKLIPENKMYATEMPGNRVVLHIMVFPFNTKKSVRPGEYILKSVEGDRITVWTEEQFKESYRPCKAK